MTITAPETPPADPIDPAAATPPAAPTAPTSAAETPPEAPKDAADAGRRKDPAAEAAARRHQLRDAEATISTQAAQITAMQRATVEALVSTGTDLRGDGSNAATLQRAADLWEVLGAEPGQFFDEVGDLDSAALADFIAASTEGRDYLTKSTERVPPVNPAKDAIDRVSRTTGTVGSGSPWAAALK